METCVLLPSEFSLVLSAEENQPHDSDLDEEESVSRGHPYDMKVRLWANQAIPAGRVFSPAEGSVRLDRLEVYSLLDDNDVRHSLGCYDEIREVECRQVRHCNWVRFVRVARRMSQRVNLVASRARRPSPGRHSRLLPASRQQGVLYRVLRPVLPNSELVVFVRDEDEPGSPLTSTPKLATDLGRRFLQRTLQDSPLDLSQSLVSTSASSKSSSEASSSLARLSTESSEALRTSASTSATSTSSSSFTSTSTSENNNENIQPAPPKKDKEKRRRQKSVLSCDFCGKTFDRPSLQRRHMRTHTGEKPHACEVCGKAFSTSSSLNTHRRIHSGEKPHQCPVCGKRFTASSNLYYHRMTHSKEKPHKCPVCSKSFPTPGDLKSHAYVHSGTWPYRCHLCERGFSKHTNLKNHLFLHTGDRPHCCDVCHKTFALACNLRAHMKTHQEGCPHVQCQRCQTEFPVSSRLVVNGVCQQCVQQPALPLAHQPDFSIRRLVAS